MTSRFSVILLMVIVSSAAILASCCRHTVPAKVEKTEIQTPAPTAGPPVILYKTREDFSKLVPVILSEDKRSVVSYPDIKDVFVNGLVAYPTLLHKGYLLDNKGISSGVAFLKLTYEEYRKLGKTPSADQLMEMILEKDPLLEMYQCGNKYAYKDLESDLNGMIDRNDFSKCRKLK